MCTHLLRKADRDRSQREGAGPWGSRARRTRSLRKVDSRGRSKAGDVVRRVAGLAPADESRPIDSLAAADFATPRKIRRSGGPAREPDLGTGLAGLVHCRPFLRRPRQAPRPSLHLGTARLLCPVLWPPHRSAARAYILRATAPSDG